MNKAKFLLFVSSAAMLLAACGGQGQPSSESSSESLPSSEPSSSSSMSESSSSGEASTSSESSSEDSPLAPLQKAFEAFPVNYTAEFIIQDEEDDYRPTLMVGDGFLANRYMYQITGYGKIARDENTYHRFDHYRPDKVDPDKGRYFEESGRTDFTDEDLVETAAIKNYFDLSKFTVTKEGNFYTMDEDNIVGYLALVNTSMGYYMFGHGTAGLEITLDGNDQIDQIRFWGVGDEDGNVDEDALWATIEFSNVGTTVDPLFFDTVASEDYDLTPSTE